MNPLANCTNETLYLRHSRGHTHYKRWLVISIGRSLMPTWKTRGIYKSREKAVADLEAAGYRSNGIVDDNYGEVWMRRDGKVRNHAPSDVEGVDHE